MRWLAAATALAAAAVLAGSGSTTTASWPRAHLLVTGSAGSNAFIVDVRTGRSHAIASGLAPFGVAVHGAVAYVSTAQGVAILDLERRRRTALVRYRTPVGSPSFGEYRGGGMGIAVSPDGSRVYVGVYRSGARSTLELLDARRRKITRAVNVGERPFDVLVSRNGRSVYSIDHDSYSVTVVDARTFAARRIRVAPLGNGAYDKPHYAALAEDGSLLLPVQGKALVTLDPRTGSSFTRRLAAETHQHGVARAGQRLVIVGTGPAGDVSGPPSLTVLDLSNGAERVVPLGRPHEQVALTRDGRHAFLTGGYLLGRGFDGLTAIDLETGARRRVPVPDLPLDVVVLSEGS